MKLEELKKLCDGATAGPWHCEGYDEDTIYNKYDRDIARGIESDADLAFIAAARTYLPKLIAVAEAAKRYKQLDDIRWETGVQTSELYPAWKEFTEAIAALEAD